MKSAINGWPIERLPLVPQGAEDVHVVTNVTLFAQCRRDRFCRCRKCKPPLAHGVQTR